MTDVLTPGLRRRLEGVEGRYEELERAVSAPETTSDRNRIREVGQELSSLAPIVENIRSLRDAERRLGDAQHLAEGDDADMRDLALEEVAELTAKAGELTTRLRSQLVPRDPLDEKNVIVEIRAGEGGEEAALFAADLYRAGAHGGQAVNTTDSAVRITHLPTGEIVTCQDERSQLKNKAKAMAVLRSRLLARAAEERAARESLARNAQIGRGERSEKMRTYNFPQDRLTDRRLGHNLSNLDRRMDGDLDDLVEALSEEDQADRLSRLEEDGD
jgi:protein subunit release factor A